MVRKAKDSGRRVKVGGEFILGGDFLRFSARIICSTSGRRKKETGEGAPSVSLHCEEYQLLEIQRVREPREELADRATESGGKMERERRGPSCVVWGKEEPPTFYTESDVG